MPDDQDRPFDDVRRELNYQLEEDQYAGFIFVGMTDDGEVTEPIRATDGNRIPPEVSRQQAIGTMVAQVYRGMVNLSIGELILEAIGVDASPVERDDPFESEI